jgi:hypothetical protein
MKEVRLRTSNTWAGIPKSILASANSRAVNNCDFASMCKAKSNLTCTWSLFHQLMDVCHSVGRLRLVQISRARGLPKDGRRAEVLTERRRLGPGYLQQLQQHGDQVSKGPAQRLCVFVQLRRLLRQVTLTCASLVPALCGRSCTILNHARKSVRGVTRTWATPWKDAGLADRLM